jgi:hypothetical protein
MVSKCLSFGPGVLRLSERELTALFNPDHGAINQEFSEEPETSTLIGLSLLVVNFAWLAYLVVKNDTSWVFLGDEFISFCTSESPKLDEAHALLERFGLKFRQIK